MKKQLIGIMAGAALALAGVACKSKEGGDKEAGKQTEPAVPTPTPTPPPSDTPPPEDDNAPPPEAAAAGEVPTEEDFEDKATAEVTAGNLETEVDKMEKEIAP